MSERSECPRYDKTLPEAIPRELTRSGDGATIEIVPDTIKVNWSPHGIGESYVCEGVVFPANVTRERSMRHGKLNDLGIGRSVTESNLEMTPLVVIAQQCNGTAWIDVEPKLLPADMADLAGDKVNFAKFGEFEGSMDLETVAGILTGEHLNVKPPELFSDIRSEADRILELEDSAVTVLSLWTIMSYVHDAFDAYPYLWFNGVKGSGKTRALEFIQEIGYHAEMGMKISNPALFRDVDHHRCTICYDEAENLLVRGGDHSVDQDRVSLFNSGYRASGTVRLVEKDGDNFITRKFRSYSPKAMASIQPIDEALQSRCLLINMMVALDAKKSEESIDSEICLPLRRRLFHLRFAEGAAFFERAHDTKYNRKLRKDYDLKNRDWELFKPLLIGAERLCPERLPEVAQFIDGQRVIRSIDNQLSTDAIVVSKIMEMLLEGENAPDDAKTSTTYKEILASLKEDFPELKWMTTRSLGNSLRRVGLGALTTRYGKGYVIRFDKALVETQMRRLGIEPQMTSAPQKTLEGVVG